jgi:hypothetical protein
MISPHEEAIPEISQPYLRYPSDVHQRSEAQCSTWNNSFPGTLAVFHVEHRGNAGERQMFHVEHCPGG